MKKHTFYNISVKLGDITKEDSDAIVNAANHTLLGGGGVDGAIHCAAGPDLLEECARLGGCLTGEAKTTSAYRLSAKFIIHTVGPIWQGGNNNEDTELANAYLSSLKEAIRVGAKSIAFPAISTGIYGFPAERAARIALQSIADFLNKHNEINEVRLICFSNESKEIHEKALLNLKNG